MRPEYPWRSRADPDIEISNIARFALHGPLTVFLGAGASLDAEFSSLRLPDSWDYYRPPREAQLPRERMPTGKELAAWLAETFEYPRDDEINLPRVAEWVGLQVGRHELHRILKEIFERHGEPGVTHQFLAHHCRRIRTAEPTARFPVIVTTNYDRLLEIAFESLNEPLDVVTYVPRNGTLCVRLADRASYIAGFDDELGLRPEERPVLVKVHGDSNEDFVITESDYLDFSTKLNVGAWLSLAVELQLRMSHFLFLGYGLGDWNIRMALHRVLGNKRLALVSWAVQLHPRELDRLWWDRRDVRILDMALTDFISRLQDCQET